MATEERILDVGRDILLSEGLQAITTNELARRARVSKKTLYSFFPSKDALVEAIVVSFMKRHFARWDRILEQDTSSMDRILASLEFIGHIMPQIQNRLVGQLETAAPSLWARIDGIRVERIEKMRKLLIQAQEDGFLRADVNPDHWLLLLTGTVQSVLTPKVLLQTGIPLVELVESVKSIYFEGLLTDKGHQHIAAKETSQ